MISFIFLSNYMIVRLKPYENACFRYLVSGSSDNLAYVWNTNLSGSELARKPIATLKGHEAEVTCVEFSKVMLFGTQTEYNIFRTTNCMLASSKEARQ